MVAHSRANIINLESSENSNNDNICVGHELEEIEDYFRLESLKDRFIKQLGVDLGKSDNYDINILRFRQYREEKAGFIRNMLKYKMNLLFK